MILVLNCGSQSIKWKLFDKKLNLKKQGDALAGNKNYERLLTEQLKQIAKFKKEIKVIGHRVVHGGEKFRNPVIISKRILKGLAKFNSTAPLHNPYNLLGIKIAGEIFPKAKAIAVFDTAFYKTLPEKAYTYPLPEKIRKKYGFRRFGFHGISHEYAACLASADIKKPISRLKIITCHLGGGSSITAINKGKAVDTTMGFTPMEGLMMMTRAGSIDPGIILKLACDLSPAKAALILNNESGVKGIAGDASMLNVKKAKNKKARLALEMYVYQIQKYIGSYIAVLKGCDLLVFTGTIGCGSAKIRNMVLRAFPKTKSIIIKTNEELAIALKIKRLIK